MSPSAKCKCPSIYRIYKRHPPTDPPTPDPADICVPASACLPVPFCRRFTLPPPSVPCPPPVAPVPVPVARCCRCCCCCSFLKLFLCFCFCAFRPRALAASSFRPSYVLRVPLPLYALHRSADATLWPTLETFSLPAAVTCNLPAARATSNFDSEFKDKRGFSNFFHRILVRGPRCAATCDMRGATCVRETSICKKINVNVNVYLHDGFFLCFWARMAHTVLRRQVK